MHLSRNRLKLKISASLSAGILFALLQHPVSRVVCFIPALAILNNKWKLKLHTDEHFSCIIAACTIALRKRKHRVQITWFAYFIKTVCY